VSCELNSQPSSLVAVGVVRRTHGLSGEVLVEPLADFADVFGPGVDCVWKSGERARNVTVSGKRGHSGRMLLSFVGIADVDAARELAGGVLCIPTECLPKPPPDFYRSDEIRGWRCEDSAGLLLGAVASLEETPAGPQLTLQTPAGKEVLIPFVQPLVVSIDASAQRIVLDLPDGLMDL
jgi:16S rRNA processing protein RimM